jgi:hypothetical protein
MMAARDWWLAACSRLTGAFAVAAVARGSAAADRPRDSAERPDSTGAPRGESAAANSRTGKQLGLFVKPETQLTVRNPQTGDRRPMVEIGEVKLARDDVPSGAGTREAGDWAPPTGIFYRRVTERHDNSAARKAVAAVWQRVFAISVMGIAI